MAWPRYAGPWLLGAQSKALVDWTGGSITATIVCASPALAALMCDNGVLYRKGRLPFRVSLGRQLRRLLRVLRVFQRLPVCSDQHARRRTGSSC